MSRSDSRRAGILLLPVTHRPPEVGRVGHVNEIVVVRKSETLALLCRAEDDPETSPPLATIYLMKDGWHMKLAHRHDRFAWSGPFESPDDAIDRYTPADVTGPLPRLAV